MHDPRAETLRIQVRQLDALRRRREQLNAAISHLEALAQTAIEQILRDRQLCQPHLRVIRDNTLSRLSQLSQ